MKIGFRFTALKVATLKYYTNLKIRHFMFTLLKLNNIQVILQLIQNSAIAETTINVDLFKSFDKRIIAN